MVQELSVDLQDRTALKHKSRVQTNFMKVPVSTMASNKFGSTRTLPRAGSPAKACEGP